MRNYIKKTKPLKPFTHITADWNYSTFHYTDGTKTMFAKNIGKLESLGIRIHKSVIVNPKCIKEVSNGKVKMNDGSIHPIARRRMEFLTQRLND